MYYTIETENEDKVFATTGDIWTYSPATGKKEKLISKEMLAQVSEEKEIVLRYDINEKKQVVYEKELSEWLEKNRDTYEHEIYVMQGVCILCGSSQKKIYYNMGTGESGELTDKDKEYYYPDWYGTWDWSL